MTEIHVMPNYVSEEGRAVLVSYTNHTYNESNQGIGNEERCLGADQCMTEIYVTPQYSNWEENRSSSNNEHRVYNCNSLELERKEQALKSEERKLFFANILSNTETPGSLVVYLLQGLGAISGCVIITSIYTLIPVHNLFEHPHYWYKFPLQIIVALYPSWALMVIFRCSNYMNIKYIRNVRAFFAMWFIGSGVLLTLYGAQYLIWSKLMGYHYPVPLNGYITACAGMKTFVKAKIRFLWTK